MFCSQQSPDSSLQIMDLKKEKKKAQMVKVAVKDGTSVTNKTFIPHDFTVCDGLVMCPRTAGIDCRRSSQ